MPVIDVGESKHQPVFVDDVALAIQAMILDEAGRCRFVLAVFPGTSNGGQRVSILRP